VQFDVNAVNENVFPSKFPGHVGIQLVQSEPGRSECRIDVEEHHLNPGMVVHGGATYTMADTGMAFALMPMLQENEIATTVEIKISYYKAVREGGITCKTECLKKGNRIAFLESELRDDAGDVIARANGTYYIIQH
jgi:acyl-CoA thioesterase